MGRVEPSHAPLTQQSHRKELRAKHARLTINKTIPNLLKTNYRARKGIENAELIVNPQVTRVASSQGVGEGDIRKPDSSSKEVFGAKKKRGKKSRDLDKEDIDHEKTTSVVSQSKKASPRDSEEPLKYKIQVSDTLQVAHILHNELPKKPKIPNQNIAVLNMASPLRPGGGVLNGATSQEESLCTRTTLLPSLREEWYRLPEVGAAWSPDVCVFRVPKVEGVDQELGRRDRFYVDVVSAGMLRFPEVVERVVRAKKGEIDRVKAEDEVEETEKVYANEADREMALNKIRALMRILQSKGTEKVVLGAWGCGAYGNPVSEIVPIWKKVLLGKGRRGKDKAPTIPGSEWAPLNEIVFAIKDRKMAEDFAAAWGDDITIDYAMIRARRTAKIGNEIEERNLEELREKIQQLEMQLEEVKTPLLRQGLEAMLETLQAQLDEAEGSVSAAMSEDERVLLAEGSENNEEDEETDLDEELE